MGWLPYFLDKLDLVYRKQSGWTGQDYGDRLPSEVFRERIVTCFLDDRVTPEVAERSGTELMTWECDYPHSDSDWPESPEVALAGMAGLDDEPSISSRTRTPCGSSSSIRSPIGPGSSARWARFVPTLPPLGSTRRLAACGRAPRPSEQRVGTTGPVHAGTLLSQV